MRDNFVRSPEIGSESIISPLVGGSGGHGHHGEVSPLFSPEAIARVYRKTKRANQSARKGGLGVARRAPMPAGGMAVALPAKGSVTFPLLQTHQGAVRGRLAELKADKEKAARAEERRAIGVKVDKRLNNKAEALLRSIRAVTAGTFVIFI